VSYADEKILSIKLLNFTVNVVGVTCILIYIRRSKQYYVVR
jgi:hypothetical protein